jgi:predicted DNA-binding protein YlxM (UPF0122 family)
MTKVSLEYLFSVFKKKDYENFIIELKDYIAYFFNSKLSILVSNPIYENKADALNDVLFYFISDKFPLMKKDSLSFDDYKRFGSYLNLSINTIFSNLSHQDIVFSLKSRFKKELLNVAKSTDIFVIENDRVKIIKDPETTTIQKKPQNFLGIPQADIPVLVHLLIGKKEYRVDEVVDKCIEYLSDYGFIHFAEKVNANNDNDDEGVNEFYLNLKDAGEEDSAHVDIKDDIVKAAKETLDTMTEFEKAIFSDMFFEDLSQSEIAEKNSISVQNLAYYKNKLEKHLKYIFEKYDLVDEERNFNIFMEVMYEILKTGEKSVFK